VATIRRDYYDILGIGRDAAEKEIKSAFRRLARELHPDVSGEPDADERFREVVEAYEVLSKPEMRDLYDRFGHEGLRTGGFRPTQFDFGNIADLFSVFFGDELFGGAGGRARRPGRGADVLAEVTIDLEEAARGIARTVDVEIPAGIHEGQRIRLSGEGHAGGPGGRAGDVYVLVHVRPHETFVRDGNDIVSSIDITMTQAALGTHLTVPTLDGEVELELEPGTQPGDVRVLRGRGMPVLQGFGRGDHRLLVNLSVPHNLSGEQRKLLEEFASSEHEDNYKVDGSFFEKLRAAFR
jgi:DnaJ-class molecular chaperone